MIIRLCSLVEERMRSGEDIKIKSSSKSAHSPSHSYSSPSSSPSSSPHSLSPSLSLSSFSSFPSFSFHSLFNTILILFLFSRLYFDHFSLLSLENDYLQSINLIRTEISLIDHEIHSLSDNTTVREIMSQIEVIEMNLNQFILETNNKILSSQEVINDKLESAVVNLDHAVEEAEKKINDQVVEVNLFFFFFLPLNIVRCEMIWLSISL
jgi:hypothetical protein